MTTINIYLVPNYKNPNGGRFYNVYKNTGERLDLSEIIDPNDIDRLEADVREATGDTSFKRIGGVITKLGEVIESTNVYNGANISPEALEAYEKLAANYQLIDRIQAENRTLQATIAEKGKARVLRKKPKPNTEEEKK